MSKRFRKQADWPEMVRQLMRNRAAMIALAVFVALAVLVLLLATREPAPQEKPRIAYLSSLPLAFGDGDVGAVISGESAADPLFQRLGEQYQLEPVDDLEQLSKIEPDALLLIQPRALSPNENVALDRWLRAGGQMLFLTDPALTRETHLPLGDKRRPLFTSMASPILSHWGLRLTLPMDEASAVVERSIAGEGFETRAPGAFVPLEEETGRSDCQISDKALLARCALGEGEAIIIADADLIDPTLWQKSGFWGEQDGAVLVIEHFLAELTTGQQ